MESREHSGSLFSICFGLKRGRSCKAERKQLCPVGRGDGGGGREEGGGLRSGPECHFAFLNGVKPDREGRKGRGVTFIP